MAMFPEIKLQEPSWHTTNVAGMNTILFEIMCLKDFRDQFDLYRKYRPCKYPDSYHAVDTAVAIRHNSTLAGKKARLQTVESAMKMPNSYAPYELKVWYCLNQSHGVDIFEKEMPPITLEVKSQV